VITSEDLTYKTKNTPEEKPEEDLTARDLMLDILHDYEVAKRTLSEIGHEREKGSRTSDRD